MWLLRIWLAITAAAAAVAVAAAIVVLEPSDRDRTAAHGHKLDLVQHNAHLLLKLDQRENVDVVARMSRDHRVVDTLTSAGANRGNATQAQASANAALLDLLAQIPADERPELCIATDIRGKQLARVGPGGERLPPLEHGLVGYPLVSKALRGMMRDDTWSIDGKLYLMAGAPVISRAKDRYVGALLIGQEVTAAYAQRLKERLVATHVPFLAQTDVAFFLRGNQIAATIDEQPLKKLPLQFAKHRGEYLKAERSAPLRVGNGANAHLVVMAPIQGEAAAHNAFYAIVTPVPAPAELLGTLTRLNRNDLLSTDALLSAGGVFLLLLGIGMLLSFANAEAPLRRLVADLRRLARGELARLPLHRYGRSHDSVAELVTEALDRAAKRAAGSPSAGRTSGAIAHARDEVQSEGLELESVSAQAGAAPPLAPLPPPGRPPGARNRAGAGPLGPSAAEPLPPLSSSPPIAPIAPPAAHSLNHVGPAGQAGSLGPIGPVGPMGHVDGVNALPLSGPGDLLESSEDAVTGHLASPAAHGGGPDPSDFGADLPLLKPIDLPNDEESLAADTIAEGGPGGATTWPSGGDALSIGGGGPSPEAVELPSPRALSPAVTPRPPSVDEERDTVMSSVPQHLARSIKDRTPTPAIEPVSADPSEADSFEDHMNQVFKEFLSIKRSCGESTENLTFDRFAAKLRKNRDALLGKYECKSVRFKVYVKDGKAALKATPMQDDD